MLNFSELKDKSVKELTNQLLELRKEQFNLRMQQGSGAAVKTHRFKAVRKSIAQIKTKITQISKEG